LAGTGDCARQDGQLGPLPIAGVREGSSVALAKTAAGTIAYVADEDSRAIHSVDIRNGLTLSTTSLDAAPAQLLVLADGRVAVTLRDRNRVQIFEPRRDASQPLAPLCRVKAPVEPFGLAATPDDQTLVVTSAWARKVTGYDANTMAVKFVTDVEREPRGLVVDDSGERAFVAHVVGGKVSVIDLPGDDHDVREIDLRVPKGFDGSARFNARAGTLPTALRQSCQGFALAKSIMPDQLKPVVPPPADGRRSTELSPTPVPRGRIFAPRVTIDPGDSQHRSSGYGDNHSSRVEAPIVSVIDAAAERTLTRAALGTRQRGVRFGECLLPRAAVVSGATGGLLVTCLGSDVLLELDPRSVDPVRLERRRWKVPSGPTGVATDDARATAVVWSQFDRQLAVIDLTAAVDSAVDIISTPRLPTPTLSKHALQGRKLFHQTDDLRIARDGRACASCHPDGREDALTWSTPVGPRQTIMLAGRVKGSGPFSWLGAHESEKEHLRITFQRLGGHGLPDKEGRIDEMDALIAYLHAMPAPMLTDALVDPHQAKSIARGKALFFSEETGCASCHISGRSDANTHDLGTAAMGDRDRKFDTPSLQFVGGTAPYFHDGRYASLLDVLTSDSQMGHTMQLSRKDAVALATYLETL